MQRNAPTSRCTDDRSRLPPNSAERSALVRNQYYRGAMTSAQTATIDRDRVQRVGNSIRDEHPSASMLAERPLWTVSYASTYWPYLCRGAIDRDLFTDLD